MKQRSSSVIGRRQTKERTLIQINGRRSPAAPLYSPATNSSIPPRAVGDEQDGSGDHAHPRPPASEPLLALRQAAADQVSSDIEPCFVANDPLQRPAALDDDVAFQCLDMPSIKLGLPDIPVQTVCEIEGFDDFICRSKIRRQKSARSIDSLSGDGSRANATRSQRRLRVPPSKSMRRSELKLRSTPPPARRAP